MSRQTPIFPSAHTIKQCLMGVGFGSRQCRFVDDHVAQLCTELKIGRIAHTSKQNQVKQVCRQVPVYGNGASGFAAFRWAFEG